MWYIALAVVGGVFMMIRSKNMFDYQCDIIENMEKKLLARFDDHDRQVRELQKKVLVRFEEQDRKLRRQTETLRAVSQQVRELNLRSDEHSQQVRALRDRIEELAVVPEANQPYGNEYTYEEIYEFCGGNSVRCKGIITGDKPGIIINERSGYLDIFEGNMIYYVGTNSQSVGPNSPGHQSPTFFPNKFLDDTRDPVQIFYKLRANQYILMGAGIRDGVRQTTEVNGRIMMVYPIRFETGNLQKKLLNLRNGYGYVD
jgi:hypothetical protein